MKTKLRRLSSTCKARSEVRQLHVQEHPLAVSFAPILRAHIEFHDVTVSRLNKAFVILVIDFSVEKANQIVTNITKLRMAIGWPLHGNDAVDPLRQKVHWQGIITVGVQFFHVGDHQRLECLAQFLVVSSYPNILDLVFHLHSSKINSEG